MTLREKARYLYQLGHYHRFFIALFKQDTISVEDKLFIEKLFKIVEG